MGFKLVNGEWLRTHSRKVASVFKRELDHDTEYTQAELLEILATHGHVYTTAEFQEIRAELFRMGVLEGEEGEPE